jgi:formamidopyrimidine-DNA glycosylase
MPELPEVETVVRDLRPLLEGRTIRAARQSKKKLRRPWKPQWSADVAGARVTGLRRRGKWILIDIAQQPTPPAPLPERRGEKSTRAPSKQHDSANSGPPLPSGRGARGVGCLRLHLGMSGQLTVVPKSEPEPDHLHLVFALDNETELRFRDHRRFGAAELFPDRAALDAEMNAELGPEPFGIGASYFRDAVTGTKRNLKALLLDQTVVAGVGNIYADEALFRARQNPGRTGVSLSEDECERLRVAIEDVMTRAIESRGSTIRDYVGGSGRRGGFQNEFAVYGRAGEPCPACEAPIALARYAGRSSHYCGSCQPLGKSRQLSAISRQQKATRTRSLPRRGGTT